MARRRRATLTDDFFHLGTNCLEGDSERLKSLRSNAFTFVNQPEEDVLSSDVGMTEQPRLFLGEDHHSAGPVGKAFEQDDHLVVVSGTMLCR